MSFVLSRHARPRPRLGAAAGLLVVALAVPLAPPTHAAQDTTTCDQPTDSSADTQNNLQFVPIDLNTSAPSPDATQPIEFQIKNTASGFGPQSPRVESVSATLVACKDGQVLPDPPSSSMGNGTSTSMSMAWSATFTWNGEYDVVIEADGRRPTATGYVAQHLRVVKRLHLAVPPKKPTGVKAAVNNGVVTITWSNADREPDLIAYEVRRAKQGSAEYVTVKDGLVRPTVSSVSDLPPEGAYRYQVIAYRPDVDAGSVSSDATAEVVAVAPGGGASDGSGTGGTTATTSASGGGSGSGSSGTSGTSGNSGTTGTTAKPTITTGGAGGTVDLSNFAAVLNARRTTPTTRVEPPDPGYEETLPFKAQGDEPAVGDPLQAAAKDDNLGQRLVSDPDNRRRSLVFVAFGLLLFVLGLTGLFVKGEVNRADDLEALDDPDAPDESPTDVGLAGATGTPPAAEVAPVAAAVAAPPAVAAGVATSPARRSRRPLPAPAGTTSAQAASDAGAPATAAATAGRRARRATVAPSPGPLPAPPAAVADSGATTSPDEGRRGRRSRQPLVAAGLTAAATIAASDEPPATATIPDTPLPARRNGRRRLPGLGPDPAELDEFTPADHAVNGHADLREVFGAEAAAPTANGHEPTTNGTSHRRRRTVAPLDAPGLDVPDPDPAPASTRKRAATTDARRAATRLPARPADDRRQGRPAVRAGGGGAGEGDRRVPVGR